MLSYKKRWLNLNVILFAVFIASCSPVPTKTQGDENKLKHQHQLQTFQNWKATGRVAFNKEDEAWHATLQYKHTNDIWRLRLIAPMGQGSFEISGSKDRVMLKDNENRVYQSHDAESLLFETLGWKMPVSHLENWIKGFAPMTLNNANTLFDAQGRINVFYQDGWKVELSSYQKVGDYDLPERIFLLKDQVKLKIIISKWKLTT